MADIDELSAEPDAELKSNDEEEAALLAEPVDPRSIPTRFSLLKKMSLSPAHYYEACQRPQDDSLASRLGAAAFDNKEALRFGTAVHELLLGNVTKVAKYTGKKRAGKAWDAFRIAAADEGAAAILNEREHKHAVAIAAAVRANGKAMRLLFEDTVVEERIDWKWIGRDVRSTPDARGTAHLADLKTSVTSQPSMFVRLALRLHYHAQAALYGDALEAANLPPVREAFIVAVEKTPPYPVTILRFTDAALEMGRKLCTLWMERLLTCEATNTWPEYSEGVVDLDVPDQSYGLEIDGKRVEF